MSKTIISETNPEKLRKISKELKSKGVPHIFYAGEHDPEIIQNTRPGKSELVTVEA